MAKGHQRIDSARADRWNAYGGQVSIRTNVIDMRWALGVLGESISRRTAAPRVGQRAHRAHDNVDGVGPDPVP